MRGFLGHRQVAFFVGLACALAAAPSSGSNDFLPGSVCESASPIPASTATFCNATPIALSAAGAGSPYPSVLNVSGMSGTIGELKLRLLDVTHSNTSTVQVRLQSPGGAVVGINGGTAVTAAPVPQASSANWTFADTAADYALVGNPLQLSATSPTASAVYLPRSASSIVMPAPAPTTLPSQLFSSLNNSVANGSWSLFVSQDTLAPQPSGTIANGWCLDIVTVAKSPLCYLSNAISGSLSASDPLQTGRIVRNGIPTLCPYPKTATLQNSTAVHYKKTDLANPTPLPICLSVGMDASGCGANTLALVLYSAFDPAHPEHGVIGDSGFSTTTTLSFSTRLDPNQTFTAVVHEITAGTGCAAFTYRIEGNSCIPPPAGDVIFADGFDGPPSG